MELTRSFSGPGLLKSKFTHVSEKHSSTYTFHASCLKSSVCSLCIPHLCSADPSLPVEDLLNEALGSAFTSSTVLPPSLLSQVAISFSSFIAETLRTCDESLAEVLVDVSNFFCSSGRLIAGEFLDVFENIVSL